MIHCINTGLFENENAREPVKASKHFYQYWDEDGWNTKPVWDWTKEQQTR